MKVTIIKGPLFEQRKEQAQEYLYYVISSKLKRDTYTLSESNITIGGFPYGTR